MNSRTRTLPLAATLTFVACVLALLGALANIAYCVDGMRTGAAESERSRIRLAAIGQVRESFVTVELALRHYVLSEDDADLERYVKEGKRLTALLSGLEHGMADHPDQAEHVERLHALAGRLLARLEGRLRAFERDGADAALLVSRADLAEGDVNEDMRRTTDRMLLDTERALLTADESVNRSYWIAVATAMAVNVVSLLVIILFYSLTRRHFDSWVAAEDDLQRHNENLESMVAARTRQLSQLSRYLIRATDNEKKRLARELHDELGSNLTAVSLDVSAVEQKLKSAEPVLALRLQRALEALRTVVGLSRRVIEDLRPSALDSMDLSEALRGYCEDFARRTGLPCETDLNEEVGDLHPDWSIALFRVAQESLTNAARYAKPTRIRLRLLREEKGVRLSVFDDGIGMPSDAMDRPMAHGLLGMRERMSMLGGTFDISRGASGTGTVVHAYIPFATDRS